MLKRTIKAEARLTEAEYFQLRRTARTAGFSVAAFIRRRCLMDERMVVLPAKDVSDLYREINHIGNNINQIARYANTEKQVTYEVLSRVESWLIIIKEKIDEKLGGL